MKTARSGASSARKRLPRDQTAADTAGRSIDSEVVDLAADAPRYETFTVRFLLDPSGGCRRTEVSSVQQGGGDAWPGYDSARLSTWIEQRIAPAAAVVEAAAPLPAAVQPQAELRPILSGLELVPPCPGALGMLAAASTLRARFTIELVGGADRALADYTARLFLRELGGASQLIGETRGQAWAGARAPVEVVGLAPAPGMYRLTAMVTIAPHGAGTATLDGLLLHIYE